MAGSNISLPFSLTGGASERGRVMGIFRSLGALARAVGPALCCSSECSNFFFAIAVAGYMLIHVQRSLDQLVSPSPLQGHQPGRRHTLFLSVATTTHLIGVGAVHVLVFPSSLGELFTLLR